MPLQQTSGNVTADAYGGGVAAVPNYIEDVFSTYLYTGTGATQTITNGIDLAGKGGMVWIKNRGSAVNHAIGDTDILGFGTYLSSNTTAAAAVDNNTFQTFNSNGFTIKQSTLTGALSNTYTSWTFRKQPKFFDVVTYTGDGTSGLRYINQSLGSAPGFIIVKKTSSTGNWFCYSRGLPSTNYSISLNLTDAATDNGLQVWDSTTTQFAVHSGLGLNDNGATYVAYLFAHNAGGFGLTGTDNVISCGSFTSNGAGAVSTTLGYEPQWVLYKPSSGTGDWRILDNMRGWAYTQNAALFPNGSYAEIVNTDPSTCGVPTATGFSFAGGLSASTTYIYIAIRRGPMKTPTSGTSVFAPTAVNNATGTQNTTSFPIDLQIFSARAGFNKPVVDRLRGVSSNTTESGQYLQTTTTNAEAAGTVTLGWDNTGFKTASGYASADMIYWNFRRAPGFFDEVCYTGTGSARTVNHNLGVAPELMIVKQRSAGSNKNWMVYSSSQGISMLAHINTTDQFYNPGVAVWGASNPTASVFNVGAGFDVNDSGSTYVAYLFATCPGVSKVGSYTGNGSTQTINCGFTGGARFVLIKRTDNTGSWFVYDTARGMTTLTDPYLLLNSTAAESATLGSVTTVTTGFAVNASILAAINTNAASYIFWAVA